MTYLQGNAIEFVINEKVLSDVLLTFNLECYYLNVERYINSISTHENYYIFTDARKSKVGSLLNYRLIDMILQIIRKQ